jgi:hypothetical protein
LQRSSVASLLSWGDTMDISGYWATLVSIIIGLGLADVLVNFHRLLTERDRVRWDALPLVWTVSVLLLLLNYWWALALNRDAARTANTAGEFGLAATIPILLFLVCASALPRRLPAEGMLDMRSEWERQRKLFATLFLLYMASNWAVAILVYGGVGWDLQTVLRAVVTALVATLLFVRSRSWNWIVALVVLASAIARLAVQQVR